MRRLRTRLLGVSLVVGILALGVAWPKAELPSIKVPDLSKAPPHDVVRVIDGDTDHWEETRSDSSGHTRRSWREH